MTVTKNVDKGYWEVQFYYKDYRGIRCKKHKRGFKTKKEAVEWAEQFKVQQSKDLSMNFQSFVELYYEDMEQRLRENTLRSKRYIMDLKIIPYFGKKRLSEITAADVRKWQSELMKQGYSQTYLKTINNQLNAVFNYAVRYYDLAKNPCSQAGAIGKNRADEMNFWTQEEFEQFLESMKNKPVSFYAFLTMYWTGVRIGELLALTLADLDFEEKTLRISKSLQRIDGKDVVTEPKTERSKRVISLPDFLVQQLQEYTGMLYGITKHDRLFHVTKSYLEHEIARGIQESGVKRIRLHDIRHSHASLLISKLGAQPKLVADRLGHERIQTTLDTYSHLYPNQGRELAKQLNALNIENEQEVNEDAE